MATRSPYTNVLSTRATPQSSPIPGSGQVPNDAGGYGWEVSDKSRFDRFAVIGSEGGYYYAGEAKLTRQNAEAALRVIQSDGLWAVNRLLELSHGTTDESGEFVPSNRIMKNDTALFLLAMAAGLGDEDTRRAAMDALPKIARTGFHFEHFYSFVRQFRGEGRVLRRGLAKWFEAQSVQSLAFQAVKYQSRDGVGMGDILRIAHPSVYEVPEAVDGVELPEGLEVQPVYSAEREAVYRWMSYGVDVDKPLRGTKPKARPGREVPGYMSYDRFQAILAAQVIGDDPLQIIKSFEAAKAATTENEIVALVESGLPREGVPTQWLNSVKVWDALLHQGKFGMPITALIRNLGKMTSIGLIAPMSEAARFTAERLNDLAAIKAGRVHPVAFLAAMLRYADGHGDKGKLSWTPVTPIVDALDSGFYTSFGAVEPTGKRRLIALDFSSSMASGAVNGISGLTPRKAAAVMGLVTARTEPNHLIVAFATSLKPVTISPRQRIDDVMKSITGPGEGTDCAVPVKWALQTKTEFDLVEVYTDGQTWAGDMHVSQAMRQYREKMGIPAKMATVYTSATATSLTDPNDRGMLDCVGFDTATPNVLNAFARGDL